MNAQASPASASAPSRLEDLVRTLQSSVGRAKLIVEIKELIAAQKASEHHDESVAAARSTRLAVGAEFLGFVSRQVGFLGTQISTVVNPTAFWELAAQARRIVADPEMRLRWLEGMLTVISILGLAIVAERGAERGLGAIRRRNHVTPSSSIAAKASALLAEILRRWSAVLVFLAAGYFLSILLFAVAPVPQPFRICLIALIEAHAVVRAIVLATGVTLQRAAVGIGVFRFDEEISDYWLVWVSRLVRLSIYGYVVVGLAHQIGIPTAGVAILANAFGLVFAGLLIMLILQNRAAIARGIRGEPQTEKLSSVHALRSYLGEIWHIVAIIYIVGGYAVWIADLPGEFTFFFEASLLSLTLIITARFAAAGGERLASRLLAISPALGRRLPDLQNRVNLYAPAMLGIGRSLIYGLAGLLVLQVWGFSVIAWLASPPGLHLVGAVLIVALTGIVAIATWEAIDFATNLYLLAPSADGGPVERSARARTLLPLFRKTLAFVLSAAVALVVLSELGVNVTPLLAGAGILGIAVGFGAQTLVKDVITGLFILMQDAVGVGDVVTVAGRSGLVEQISIRSIRLRGLDGTVSIIPFSEVSTIQNMTKDFAYALFSLAVSYREDVDEVIDVIHTVAEEVQADPGYSWRILEPIEVLGLDQFADSAVIIKARIKTKPIEQWNVMREYNKRLKRRFDHLGIEMPFPHRTIYFGIDKNGGSPPVHIVASQTGEAVVVPIKAARSSVAR